MKTRIQLSDADRPEEIFEVDVEEVTATRLAVSVPNTVVSFALTRREEDQTFAGSLGGRVLCSWKSWESESAFASADNTRLRTGSIPF